MAYGVESQWSMSQVITNEERSRSHSLLGPIMMGLDWSISHHVSSESPQLEAWSTYSPPIRMNTRVLSGEISREGEPSPFVYLFQTSALLCSLVKRAWYLTWVRRRMKNGLVVQRGRSEEAVRWDSVDWKHCGDGYEQGHE